MRPPSSYYLTTAAALLAILLCGYGVGFLVGEHLTQDRLAPGGAGGVGRNPWGSETLERLTRELGLSPEQREQVAREIRASSRTIEQARREATGIYRNELLDLHRRLLPHLDPAQRRQIEASSRTLENNFLDERPTGEDADGNEEES